MAALFKLKAAASGQLLPRQPVMDTVICNCCYSSDFIGQVN